MAAAWTRSRDRRWYGVDKQHIAEGVDHKRVPHVEDVARKR
jgi:hypothetical protein